MAKSNLCENLQQKRFDYVAGMLAGGFHPVSYTHLTLPTNREV